MSTKKEIPVLLLTGYLGSGKTTLVNHILTNERGVKFAVIVNDIGEVNIDADLIQKGGVVGAKDDSLVALQNGCICCTLKMDLVEQVYDLVKSGKFDYIVIEASGVCEPAPIAQTICSIPRLGEAYRKYGIARLDCIVTVVDALRLQDEFGGGDNLTRKDIGEEDIENLIIQQIEFCNIILLNKASMVSPDQLKRIKAIVKTIQPQAKIIDCDYAKVDLDEIINTGMFHFERVATSAAWIREIERPLDEIEAEEHHHHDDEEDEDHEHEHEHDHDHDECCGHEHDHEHHHDHGECDDPNCSCHDHHHHHHADEVFISWGKETPKVYTQADIDRILTALDSGDYGAILRAKGIVNGTDGAWIEFDYVPEEHEIRAGHPDYTGRLCVIGSNLKEEKLAELFGL